MISTKDSQVQSAKPNSIFNFFFQRFDYFLEKGKGFSVYSSTETITNEFTSYLEAEKKEFLCFRLSNLDQSKLELPSKGQLAVIIQDLPFDQFFKKLEFVVDRLIYPLWFLNRSICLFSYLAQSCYESENFSSELIHKDLGLINRYLLLEQIEALLSSVNIPFSSPDSLVLSPDKTVFTPIEEKMRNGLEEANLSYKPQVRFGRYTVDFLVQTKRGSVIIECDGAAYHSKEKDAERDQILSLQGYPIFHFSGSEINSDVNKCISNVIENDKQDKAAQYPIDGNLDSDQRDAVEVVSGPVRVLAPAGSGKTKTLTNRIAYLLNQGIDENKILALAFNKKACEEMLQRLDQKMIRGVEVRTFHSLGYEIIRAALKWSFDEKNNRQTLRELMGKAVAKHYNLKLRRGKDPLDGFFDALRRTKMELIPLETITVDSDDHKIPFEPIFQDFLKSQIEHRFLNFDDMIYFAIRILMNDAKLREHYQNRFEYVLVDEYQDLNRSQLLLLQILALPQNNLFVVGDDDQMIYGWRGAEVRHIVDFHKRFSISADYVLTTNYRSSKKIVRHSRWLIDHNKERVFKNIHSSLKSEKGSFFIKPADNLWEQSEAAAAWIYQTKISEKLRWKDFAVLFRTNADQIPVALALEKLDIPHTPVSEKHLFMTSVGKQVYSYLTVILHPTDAKADDFETILKYPNKYFRNELIEKATNWEKFATLHCDAELEDWVSLKLLDFINRIHTLQLRAETAPMTSSALLAEIDTALGLKNTYRDNQRLARELDDASDDVIFDVISSIAGFYPELGTFYRYVYKAIEDGAQAPVERSNKDEVFLITIHRAKGREFPNVVFFNLSESARETKDQEEERRVAYVGATRAKDRLFVTYLNSKKSPFIKELALANHLVEMTEERIVAELGLKKNELDVLQNEKLELSARIQKLLDKYPQLNSNLDGNLKNRNAIKRWMRDFQLNRARGKVEILAKELDELLTQRIIPLSEEIDILESEIQFRKKILISQSVVLNETGSGQKASYSFNEKVQVYYQAQGHRILKTAILDPSRQDYIVLSRKNEIWYVRCISSFGKIAVTELETLIKLMASQKATKGAVITAGLFSQEAIEWGKGKKLALVDGEMFLEAYNTLVERNTETISL